MPMRQLRNCEFCGSDAAGVYEALPPELSPTEAEQRRIVLCSDCAGTLETVIDPLLERLGVDTDDASTTGSDGGVDDRSVAAEASVTDDSGDAESNEDPAPDGADQIPTADPEPDAEEGPVQWGDSDPAGGEGAAEPDGQSSDPVRNGIPGVGPSDDDATELGTAEPTAGGDGTAADGADDATGNDTDASAAAEATPGDEPEEFRTVMRLLGNREFPVERGAIVELAASAYELDEGHVDRIIDHAVDRGVIDDDGGTLRRN